MAVAYASAAAAAVANLGSTSVVPAKPTGVASGDLLIAVCWSGAGAVCTWTAPAGWSAADASNSANGVGTYIFHRVADGTEGSTFSFTRSSTGNNAGAMVIRLTGADATTPVAAAAVVGASSTTVVLSSVTATAANTELLQLCLPISVGTFTWTPPGAAVQEAIITASGTALQAMIGDETVGSGATGTRTWTHTTATSMRGAILAINVAVNQVSAVIQMDGAGTLGTAALDQVPSPVTMAGAGALGITASQQIPSAVTMDGAGVLIAGPGTQQSAAVTIAGGGTLGVTAQHQVPSSVTMAGAGTLGVVPYPLSQFTGAIARRETARANIGIFGYSGVEGYPAPYAKSVGQKLATKLRAAYPTSGHPTGAGYIGIPSTAVQGLATTQVSWSTGTYAEAYGWGGQHGIWYTTPAQNGILTLTLPYAATTVAIDILKGSLGNAAGGRYRVNGGAWTTFNTLDTTTGNAQVVLTGTFAAGDTIDVGYNAGTGNVIVTGFDVSNGDESKGIQVHTFGHSGYTLAKWMGQTGGAPQWITEIIRTGCSLIIFQDIPVNDGNAAGASPLSAASAKTALGNMIDFFRSSGYTGDILLAATQDLSASITFVDPWSSYVTAIRDTAAAKGCAFLDLGATVPPPPNAIYYSDGVHTNTNGDVNELIADAYMGQLAPPIDSSAITMAGTGTLAVTPAQQIPVAVAMAGAGTLGTGTGQTIPSAVTIAGAGSLGVSGQQDISNPVTLAGAGQLVAAPGGSLSTTVSLDGVGTLGTTSLVEHQAPVVIAGAGDLAVAVDQAVPEAVVLAGAGDLGVVGESQIPVALTLAGAGTLLATAISALAAQVTIAGAGTLGAGATVLPPSGESERTYFVVAMARDVVAAALQRQHAISAETRAVTVIVGP